MRLLSLTILAMSVHGMVRCPSDSVSAGSWTRSSDGTKCWTVLPSKCSFTCCADKCASIGASLPCVQNSQIKRELMRVTESYGSWWVGLYQRPADDSRTHTGWYRWAAQNCSSAFRYWDLREPNDRDCMQENCAVSNRLYSSRGALVRRFEWFDEPCTARQACVCEYPGAISDTLTAERAILNQVADRPLTRSSGCSFSTELEAFAGFRLLLPLGILLCTAATVTSVIRQKRRRARELISRGLGGTSTSTSVPLAVAMPTAHGHARPSHVTTAVPVAQGNPVATAVAVAAVQGTPVPGGAPQMTVASRVSAPVPVATATPSTTLPSAVPIATAVAAPVA